MDYQIPKVRIENLQLDIGQGLACLFVASLLIGTVLGLLVINRVSNRRSAFVSILAGAATWLVATSVLFLGAAFCFELVTGRS